MRVQGESACTAGFRYRARMTRDCRLSECAKNDKGADCECHDRSPLALGALLPSIADPTVGRRLAHGIDASAENA
jgi:hypothetical protein